MDKPTPEEYEHFDKVFGKHVDNPGPKWEAEKIANGEHKVSSWYDAPFMMPTSWLKSLEGENGEHKILRGPKPDGSGNYGAKGDKHPAVMDKIKRLKEGTSKFEPIHVVGHHQDYPTIHEGNHSVEAADEMGMEYAPVEFHHQNGNERFFHPLDIIHEYENVMHPKKPGK
jgi:hypothetical protein